MFCSGRKSVRDDTNDNGNGLVIHGDETRKEVDVLGKRQCGMVCATTKFDSGTIH